MFDLAQLAREAGYSAETARAVADLAEFGVSLSGGRCDEIAFGRGSPPTAEEARALALVVRMQKMLACDVQRMLRERTAVSDDLESMRRELQSLAKEAGFLS
jgi:hypothetical protein